MPKRAAKARGKIVLITSLAADHPEENEMRKREADGDSVVPWADLDALSELRDDADDFEDALFAEMRLRGAIDVIQEWR
jgi:hypothetical protein